MTRFVHGENGFNDAIATTEKLFANQHAPAESLSIEDLKGMEGIVRAQIAKEKYWLVLM